MCLSPMSRINPKHSTSPSSPYLITFPCGKCPLCLKKRINHWSFRIQKEMQRSVNNRFITLTYNEDNYPSDMSVSKRHVQLFIKRLRYYHAISSKEKTQPLRYIAVGEYGANTHRAHYHLLLFNAPSPQDIKKAWDMGYVGDTPITSHRIRYIFKYISKPKQGLALGRSKEFQLTSKGIGSNYVTSGIKEYHNRQVENCTVIDAQGVNYSIPRYYKNKIYSESQLKKVNSYLEKRAITHPEQQIQRLSVKKGIPVDKLRRSVELSRYNVTFRHSKTDKI